MPLAILEKTNNRGGRNNQVKWNQIQKNWAIQQFRQRSSVTRVCANDWCAAWGVLLSLNLLRYFLSLLCILIQHSGYRYVTMYTKTYQGNWKVGRVTYKQAPSQNLDETPTSIVIVPLPSTLDITTLLFRPARSVGQAWTQSLAHDCPLCPGWSPAASGPHLVFIRPTFSYGTRRACQKMQFDGKIMRPIFGKMVAKYYTTALI